MIRNVNRLQLFIAAAATLLATSAASAEVVERIVAKVNGDIVTLTELESEVDSMLERLGPASSAEEQAERRAQIREQVLQSLIDNKLVLQVAADRGLRVPTRFFEDWKKNVMEQMNIDSEEELERQVELQGGSMAELRQQFEEGLLIQEIRRMEVDSKVSVSEPEIGERYRENIDDYTEPARVRLREIVARFDETNEVEKGQKIRRLRQDIEQGADFAEVARMHSESGSREAGGDLGFFEQGELTEPLAEVAFSLAPGEVSDVIRLGTAFYIIRVEEKIEATTKPLEEVRKEVGDAVFEEKMAEQMERYLRQLRERAKIEIKL